MKKIILLFVCLYACMNQVQAADDSRYIEFARTYGIVRYFSPNPYTQDWSESDWMKVCALLANRIETQPLDEVFRPLLPRYHFRPPLFPQRRTSSLQKVQPDITVTTVPAS